MYFNWDSPSRKQNRKVIGSEFAWSHHIDRNNCRWLVKTGEKLKGERDLRFIGEKTDKKRKSFDGKNQTKVTLESFAGFSLSLIWSYFPPSPQCLQMYLSGKNLYNVLEHALFYLQSGLKLFCYLVFMIKTSHWSLKKGVLRGVKWSQNGSN